MPDRRLRIISPDGSERIAPAMDRRALRRVIESPALSDRDRAELLAACPLCGARPGRACRNRAGRPSWHGERLAAYLESRDPRP